MRPVIPLRALSLKNALCTPHFAKLNLSRIDITPGLTVDGARTHTHTHIRLTFTRTEKKENPIAL